MTLVDGYLIESVIICFFYIGCIYYYWKIKLKCVNKQLKLLAIGATLGIIGKIQRFAVAIFGVQIYDSTFTVHWVDIVTTSMAFSLIAIAAIRASHSN